MHWIRNIEVLTPLFNRGAYQDTPEIRVPSIRGMVRWWFRALGGTSDEEKEIFGGMKRFGRRLQNEVIASNLVFRIRHVQVQREIPDPFTLPHDPRKGSPQAAFAPGMTFELEVFTRFGDLNLDLERKAKNALETWLLLGSLGLRANRAGGSVWPADSAAPATSAALGTRLKELGCRWPVMIAGSEVGSNLDLLRAAATDTVNGADWVFGYARGRDRQASALKFKVVHFESGFRLLIAASDKRVLDEARRALGGHRCKPETWAFI